MKVQDSPALFVGVLGLGALQIIDLYIETAPSLQDIRHAPEGATSQRQELLDTDILVGSTVAIIALMACAVMGSPWPAVMFIGGFAAVSFWHHAVLHSPDVRD